MTDIPAISIKEVLGIRPADDGSHMLVGLQSAAGEEVVLAIGNNEVMEIVSDFFQATSIVPFQKGAAAQGQDAIEVDDFELGKIQGSSDLEPDLAARDRARFVHSAERHGGEASASADGGCSQSSLSAHAPAPPQ